MCRTYEWNRAQPETVAMFEGAAKRLRAAGANVRDVSLPPPFAGLAAAQTAIMVFEVAKSLSHENLVHRKDLSADMTRMIDAGLAVSPQQYDAARSLTRTCRAMLPEIFNTFDVLVAPSAVGEAPAGIAATGDPTVQQDMDAVARARGACACRRRAARIAARRQRRGRRRCRSCDAAGRGMDTCAARWKRASRSSERD